MSRKLLFSITAGDFVVETMRSSGKGGQNVNKRETKVRITHKASGATGQAQDHREQAKNKKLAFERLLETRTWKAWYKLECAKRMGILKEIETQVERDMDTKNLIIEVKDDDKWIKQEIK